MTMGAPVCDLNSPSMVAVVTGWWRAKYLPCKSPLGNTCQSEAAIPATTPTRRKMRACSTNFCCSKSSWSTRASFSGRSEEHTSELQSHLNLVCRLLLEKKKIPDNKPAHPPPRH